MAKSKKSKMSGPELTSALVSGIVDRLIANEKRIDSLRRELDDHMNMIAELQPKLAADGSLKVVAMIADSESVDSFDVVLTPVSATKQQKQ